MIALPWSSRENKNDSLFDAIEREEEVEGRPSIQLKVFEINTVSLLTGTSWNESERSRRSREVRRSYRYGNPVREDAVDAVVEPATEVINQEPLVVLVQAPIAEISVPVAEVVAVQEPMPNIIWWWFLGPQKGKRRQVVYRADKITNPYEKKFLMEDNFLNFPYVGQRCSYWW